MAGAERTNRDEKEGMMKMGKRTSNRGLGYIFRPKYRDAKTGEWRASSIYWVQVRHRGKRHRVNSHSANRSDAVALLNKLKGEMSQGRLVTPNIEKTTFTDLTKIVISQNVSPS
jgi:hypothetical protein